MLRLIAFTMCIAAFNCSAQTLTVDYSPTDLIGSWEYQIPNTNEYIKFVFTEEFGSVTGEFMKFTKDSNGNIDQIFFDSRADNLPNQGDYAIFGIDVYDDIPGPNTFGMWFKDSGVTNNNIDARLVQLGKLIISKPCGTCPLELYFTLFPKNPGIGTAANSYQINIPINITLIKIN